VILALGKYFTIVLKGSGCGGSMKSVSIFELLEDKSKQFLKRFHILIFSHILSYSYLKKAIFVDLINSFYY
jgi:hypothetical protein